MQFVIRPDLTLASFPLPIFESSITSVGPNDIGFHYLLLPTSTLSSTFSELPHHWVAAIRFDSGTIPWPSRGEVLLRSNSVLAEVGLNPLANPSLHVTPIRSSLLELFDGNLNYRTFVSLMPQTPFIYSFVGQVANTSPYGRSGRGENPNIEKQRLLPSNNERFGVWNKNRSSGSWARVSPTVN